MTLPPVIKDIAIAVFPLASAHTNETGRILTFTVTESGVNGEDPQLFRIHSFSDAMVQIRIFPNENRAVIHGVKGQRKIESEVADLALLDSHVSMVSELLHRLD